ncbi:hypothetical protein NC652_018986 [Populus alba x Populus x berolinensis]|nr:hypothetical protein NC652_018986 [Populus alba x Populus x berolinensis]
MSQTTSSTIQASQITCKMKFIATSLHLRIQESLQIGCMCLPNAWMI